jgi:hypothetical protein
MRADKTCKECLLTGCTIDFVSVKVVVRFLKDKEENLILIV